MKKTLLTVVLIASLGFAGAGLTACDQTCDKAADRMAECLDKQAADSSNKKTKKLLTESRKKRVKACRQNKANKKLSNKCLKEKDCKKFLACMGEKA